MSDLKITAWDATIPPTILIRSVTNGRDLLRIEPDGTVTGAIEDASEAARVFVEHIRRMTAQPTQSDVLKIARDALEGMVRYSGMRESWQDGNPQYVNTASDAIDAIDAALQESSK